MKPPVESRNRTCCLSPRDTLAAMPRHTWGHRDRVSASPHTSLCGTSSPYLSSTPLTCVFPVPGAPMSSITSPVYSPESSSWSSLWDGHKVGLSTPHQPEWQEHQEAPVPSYLSLKSPPKCTQVHGDGLENEMPACAGNHSLVQQTQPQAELVGG